MRLLKELLIVSALAGIATCMFLFTNFPAHKNFYLFSQLFLLVFIYFTITQVYKKKRELHYLSQKKDEIETKLNQQENLFDAIFYQTNMGIALLSLEGNFLKVNKLLLNFLGHQEDDLLKMNFFHILPAEDLKNIRNSIKKLMANKIKSFQSEQKFLHKSKEMVWVMLTLLLIRDNTNQPVCYILQIQNISTQKKAEERLKLMAYHDPLTGLANRSRLQQFADQIIASSRRHQQEFALLFLDLDRFKIINDTIGHDAGDTLLKIIAERLHSLVRNNDLVVRLGGDEFVVVITDVKKIEAVAAIAQKVLDSILEVIVIDGQEIYITTSIGISLYPFDGQTVPTLLKHADLALYRAKEQGKNNYQFYTMEMTSKAQEKLALQNALGHALSKNEFLLHYQPKLDLKTKKISGVEAFLRWSNAEFRAITPGEIITLAEDTGLIVPVSDWVLRMACQQLKTWHKMGYGSLTMAVNCTARQFKQSGVFENILNVIRQADLLPSFIEVEVTESMIMQNSESILRVLYALKDLGVQISIDDFGTGYWSLNNLRKLSIDSIKIDKTFIRQIPQDETSRAIIIAIIAMANKLNVRSIAEGVETQEQYDFLLHEGCTEVQGYYLTQPLPENLLTNFLNNPILEGQTRIESLVPGD